VQSGHGKGNVGGKDVHCEVTPHKYP